MYQNKICHNGWNGRHLMNAAVGSVLNSGKNKCTDENMVFLSLREPITMCWVKYNAKYEQNRKQRTDMGKNPMRIK